MAVQDHLAVLEWPDEGKGLVVLDHAGTSPESFRAAVDRVLQAHQAGLLFLVAVGGGDQAQAALADADRDAHNQDHLGVYQLTDDGGCCAWPDAGWHPWNQPSSGSAKPRH